MQQHEKVLPQLWTNCHPGVYMELQLLFALLSEIISLAENFIQAQRSVVLAPSRQADFKSCLRQPMLAPAPGLAHACLQHPDCQVTRQSWHVICYCRVRQVVHCCHKISLCHIPGMLGPHSLLEQPETLAGTCCGSRLQPEAEA